MKSDKVIHHPGRDGEQFSTVADELESLRDNRVTGPTLATDNAVVRYDGTTGKLVQDSGVIIDDDDNVSGVETLTATTLAGDSVTKNGDEVAITAQTFTLCGIIESPEDKTYPILINVPFAGAIASITTKSSSGTCTLTGKINGVALGGTANSVSTTEQEQTHSTTNAFVAGDDISLTVSSNSSCAMLSVTIKYTRTLA